MIPRTVAALCISHTSPAWNQTTLPPFAMWPAFPAADYYGGSVAVGLAPRRRSHIPGGRDVERDVGAWSVPLGGLAGHRPARGRFGRRRLHRPIAPAPQ